MTRNAKATAQQGMARQADGFTTTQFQAPKLRAAAKADRGHARMTPAEYATHRLGRAGAPEGQKRGRWAELRIGRRKVTRR